MKFASATKLDRKSGGTWAPGTVPWARATSDQIYHCPWRQVAGAPQIPAGNRTPGLPFLRPAQHMSGLGRIAGVIGFDLPARRSAGSPCARRSRCRKDIRPAQPEDQQHLHRPLPTPRTCVSRSTISASVMRRMRDRVGTVPSSVFAARSRRAFILFAERPQPRSNSSGAARM